MRRRIRYLQRRRAAWRFSTLPTPVPNVSDTDPVKAQYERWSYPLPVDDLARFPFNPPASRYPDLKSLYFGFWPTAPAYREDIDILVAGCGTVAGACFAYYYPQARVTAFDISSASLAHEEYLKRKHNLHNLTLRQLRVEDAAALAADFDFISVLGVLHHIEDPTAGLRALAGRLRPEGVISIMVYARYGRVGVYMLQELFRIMGLRQEPADVQVVREALTAVGPHHPVRQYLHMARRDLSVDAGLVDTFLHPRDQAYTVAQCLQMVEEAGLAFQGWDDNLLYYPELQVPANHPFRSRLERLPEPALWQAVELLFGTIAGHYFHACRRDRDPAKYRVVFEGDRFLSWIPVPRVDPWPPPAARPSGPLSVKRSSFPAIPLDPKQTAIFDAIDERKTIRDCLGAAGLDPSQPAIVEAARTFFRSLWRIGYMVFRW
jgi:SAM-dependent methyltransferase